MVDRPSVIMCDSNGRGHKMQQYTCDHSSQCSALIATCYKQQMHNNKSSLMTTTVRIRTGLHRIIC